MMHTVTAAARSEISDRRAWSVPLEYATGPHSFFVEYSKAENDKAAPFAGRDTRANLANLTYVYSLSKRTSLPPPQAALEADYKSRLGEQFGIVFNQLFTMANMPIQRFGSLLICKGQFNAYMATLHGTHRVENLEQVMCRNLISVDWQGYLYDCDFNQQLGLALTDKNHTRLHITQAAAAALEGLAIRVADHCYGCTAGQGSSCGGALGNETAAAPSCAA